MASDAWKYPAAYFALFIGGVLSLLIGATFGYWGENIGWLSVGAGIAASTAGWLISRPYATALHARQRLRLYGWVCWWALLTPLLLFLLSMGFAVITDTASNDPEGMLILLVYVIFWEWPVNVVLGLVFTEVVLNFTGIKRADSID